MAPVMKITPGAEHLDDVRPVRGFTSMHLAWPCVITRVTIGGQVVEADEYEHVHNTLFVNTRSRFGELNVEYVWDDLRYVKDPEQEDWHG